jgi:RNA polymerase sigma factor for flagellar operon FliA
MSFERVFEQNVDAAVLPDREEIIKQHMGLIVQTVERLCGAQARLSGSFDDLVSAGMIGLLSAYDCFDPDRGCTFSTYAHPRVRGAVLDELRRQDVVPRSVRRKRRAVAGARDTVRARNGGSCSDSDVAALLGVDVPTLRRWEVDAESRVVESIDNSLEPWSQSGIVSESWASPSATPDAILETEEEVDGVREALAALPEQERLVLILYFYEDLKLRQIGDILGVSESRVSQIRTRGLKKLKETLAMAAA